MTLQQLEYFCEISRYKSFHKAAEMLHVSQPSLSNAILRLESELGFLLFDRRKRHIELTKYGSYFYRQIEPLLLQLRFVTEKTQTMAKSDTGFIDLAYNTPFGKRLIPKLARGFLELPENKNCTFHFHQASSHKIVEGLLLGKFDVGICSMDPLNPKIKYVPLLNQKLIAIVPRGHELADCGTVALKDLLKFPYVDYTDEVGIYYQIHKFFDDEKLLPKTAAKAPDEESIAALVSEGFGVSFIAEIDALKNFDVVQLSVQEENCFKVIYAAYDENNYLTPAAGRFLEYCLSDKSVIKTEGCSV